MNVVNISLDPKILDPESVVAIRVRAYGEIVENYSVVVPTPATMTVRLSDSAVVYGVSSVNKVLQLWHMYRQLVMLVKADKCDVIASSDMYYLGLIALFVARKYHLGLEIQVLGIEKLTSLRKKLAVYVLGNASVVRALSHRLKKRLKDEFGILEDHVNVVSIYVDVTTLGLDERSLNESDAHQFKALRDAFEEKYGGYINFLTVSRLVPIKRIPMQLNAMKQIVSQDPNVRLHIVGDGPMEESLKTEVRKLGLNQYVIFHGRRTGLELGIFYLACDCFLLTSDYEGWGMVVIEAATAGLPIVMTDVGSAGEFIVNGESGIIIPVGDTEALAEAMHHIISDSQLRESLSFGTKKALRSLQSFDEVLRQYKKNWEIALTHSL